MKKNYFIFACSFFFSLGANILGFSLIYRLTDRLAFTPGQIGTYIALGQLFYFLGCNLYQWFGSAFNPVKVFPAAAALVFAASLPLSYGESRFFAYGAYWVLQLSTGLFWPPVMAYLTGGLDQKDLNRQIGIFNRSWMAANIVGPLIAGTLYNWNSTVNFIILNSSYFIVLVFLFLMWRFSSKETALPLAADASGAVEAEKEESSWPADKRLDLFRYKGWIGAFSSTLVLGVLINIVPLHIRDGMGYTERSAGIILFLRSVAGFIGFDLLARFTSWQFNRRWFLIVQGGLMLCSLLFLLAGGNLFAYFAVVLFCGLLNSSCYNNSIFYSSATGKSPKKNMALHEIFLAIGNAAGSAGGGVIYQHFRFTGVCIALFMALGLNLAFHIVLDRKYLKMRMDQGRGG